MHVTLGAHSLSTLRHRERARRGARGKAVSEQDRKKEGSAMENSSLGATRMIPWKHPFARHHPDRRLITGGSVVYDGGGDSMTQR